MGYVSEAELLARSVSLDEGIEKLAKSLTVETDLFVSYSRKDVGLIPGVIGLLTDLGATPYVDAYDQELQLLSTAQEKAKLLRRRITQCGRLLLLLTQRSTTSHWTPWEVGLADGMFGISHVATFPVKALNGSDEWGLREYLATYPQLREQTLDGRRAPSKIVCDPADGLYWEFEEWLRVS